MPTLGAAEHRTRASREKAEGNLGNSSPFLNSDQVIFCVFVQILNQKVGNMGWSSSRTQQFVIRNQGWPRMAGYSKMEGAGCELEEEQDMCVYFEW